MEWYWILFIGLGSVALGAFLMWAFICKKIDELL